MSAIHHHPSDLTLAGYAAGTLDEARRLVVATHLTRCAACSAAVRGLLKIGGTLLANLPPAPLRHGALAAALRRLDAPLDAPLQSPGDEGLPASLAAYALGPWRRIGGGVEWRTVAVPVVDDIRVFMLRARGGTRLPRH